MNVLFDHDVLGCLAVAIVGALILHTLRSNA